ncbi:SDR family NAD(P)-dependent oxidoreductase [Xylanimonas ulmi]|uniref:Short-subunit dehydrogenase n=1 Tax=Xylanimonas ulmi TaxID=228973 RepID=A0A4Q7M0H3_9MICO|nr:SDR family NAD(P)-dependent oxidoreductase [Xylanibacterium ulmi]RZS61255.1 short-subunit dehydrogenase [Xylanibacterium ulmi]
MAETAPTWQSSSAVAATPPPARTALVTGASRGIGRAVAQGLAAAGLDIALLARDVARLDDVAASVRASGRRAVVLPADVTDVAQVRDAVARGEDTLGGVDLLVDAAGVIDAEVPAWEADPEEWWRTVEVDVRGPFLLAHTLAPRMLARGGGRLVHLASGASSHEMAGSSAYNVGKTALVRLGAHLHEAGFARGLRVFEVAPGVVATDMTASMPMHAGRTQWTPVERTVELVVAVARGELDACSGWFLRVTHDTVASLRELAAGARPPARRLRVLPAGAEDPLAETLTGR